MSAGQERTSQRVGEALKARTDCLRSSTSSGCMNGERRGLAITNFASTLPRSTLAIPQRCRNRPKRPLLSLLRSEHSHEFA